MKSYKRIRSIFLITLVFTGIAVSYSKVSAIKKSDFPFFPSLVQTSSGGKVSLKFFTRAEKCGQCHVRQYQEWKGSMHSLSFKDPVWQAIMRIYSRQTGGRLNPQCVGCHTPIGLVTESVKTYDDLRKAEGIVTDGVQCDVCHVIKKAVFIRSGDGSPRNASFVLAPGNIKFGPYKDSESDFHLNSFSSLHTQATICGTCHDLFHSDSNYSLARTYDEWKNSVYAAKRIICQDCHMIPADDMLNVALTLKKKRYPGQGAEGGPHRNNTYNHRFIGANATVTRLLGADSHSRQSEDRLKIAARMNVKGPRVIFGGELCKIKVMVTNQAAGHSLPTGLTEFRQMWIFLEVKDKNGMAIFSSGRLDPWQGIDPKATVFTTIALDRQGRRTFFPWKMATVKSDYRIPPKSTSTNKYTFIIPENARGPITVYAELRYRSFPQSLINLLFKEKAFRVKYTVMTTADWKIRLFRK